MEYRITVWVIPKINKKCINNNKNINWKYVSLVARYIGYKTQRILAAKETNQKHNLNRCFLYGMKRHYRWGFYSIFKAHVVSKNWLAKLSEKGLIHRCVLGQYTLLDRLAVHYLLMLWRIEMLSHNFCFVRTQRSKSASSFLQLAAELPCQIVLNSLLNKYCAWDGIGHREEPDALLSTVTSKNQGWARVLCKCRLHISLIFLLSILTEEQTRPVLMIRQYITCWHVM